MPRIKCPNCQKSVSFAEEHVGKFTRCSQCREKFQLLPESTRIELSPKESQLSLNTPVPDCTCFYCGKGVAAECVQLTFDLPNRERRLIRVWRCQSCHDYHNADWWYIQIPVAGTVFLLLFTVASFLTIPDWVSSVPYPLFEGAPFETEISGETAWIIGTWIGLLGIPYLIAVPGLGWLKEKLGQRKGILPSSEWLEHPRHVAALREFQMAAKCSVVTEVLLRCKACGRTFEVPVDRHGTIVECPHCHTWQPAALGEELALPQ